MTELTVPLNSEPLKLGAAEAFERFLRLSVADGDASPRTLKAYREGLSAFLAWCLSHSVDPLTSTFDHVQAYRAWLVAQGYKRSTVGLRLVAVRVLYAALARWGVRRDNPADGVRTPKEKRTATAGVLEKAIAPKDVPRLLAELPASWAPQDVRNACIVRLMLFHGLRAEEMTSLDVPDLDLDGFSWLRVTGKGGKVRVLLICPEVRQDLLAWARVGGLPGPTGSVPLPLFYRMDVPGYRRLSVRAIERIVDGYLIKAKLKKKGRSAHALRHTYAVLACLGGAKGEALAESMGHDDTKTTDIYKMAAAQYQDNPASAVAAALRKEMDMNNETKLGVGKAPNGEAVAYHQDDKGLIIVRGKDGAKITHSDSIEHLKTIGYSIEMPKAADGIDTPRKNVPLTPDEEGQVQAFLEPLDPAKRLYAEKLLAVHGERPLRTVPEILADVKRELDGLSEKKVVTPAASQATKVPEGSNRPFTDAEKARGEDKREEKGPGAGAQDAGGPKTDAAARAQEAQPQA